MASDIYTNLDPQKCEVRLLTILPRKEQPLFASPTLPVADDLETKACVADVHCRLSTESLDRKIPYVALSYVWGP